MGNIFKEKRIAAREWREKLEKYKKKKIARSKGEKYKAPSKQSKPKKGPPTTYTFKKSDLTESIADRWEQANERREKLVKNTTKAESIMKAHLTSLGVKYEFQKIYFTLDNYYYIIDFFLPDWNIAIEVDGKYHADKKQQRKDSGREKKLKKAGIRAFIRMNNSTVTPDEAGRKKIKNRIQGIVKKLDEGISTPKELFNYPNVTHPCESA